MCRPAPGARTTGTCAYCQRVRPAGCQQSTAAAEADAATLAARLASAELLGARAHAAAAPPADLRRDARRDRVPRVLLRRGRQGVRRGCATRAVCSYGRRGHSRSTRNAPVLRLLRARPASLRQKEFRAFYCEGRRIFQTCKPPRASLSFLRAAPFLHSPRAKVVFSLSLSWMNGVLVCTLCAVVKRN